MIPGRSWFSASTKLCILLAILVFLVMGCKGKGEPLSPDLGATGVQSATLDGVGLVAGETASGRPSGQRGTGGGGEYLENEVLVVLHDSVSGPVASSMLSGWPLRLRKVIPCRWGTIYELNITDGTPVPTMVQRLKADSRVRFAEPNYILYFDEVPYWPHDPLWESDDIGFDPRDSVYDQWGPAKIGASIVWNDSKGSEDVVVAILDTGIRYDHEDLQDNIWINQDETPGNGQDDDLNGWVDDWWGWDCWDDDNDPWDDGAYAWYHGTACSGVTAAVQDNNRGLSGVAPGIKVMALKVDLTGAGGLVSTVCLAFEYARINEADICSMSFGTNSYSEILETACIDTWDNGDGVILMASAGNDDTTALKYPTGYDCVMTIGATVPFGPSYDPIDEARISSGIGYYWGSNYGDHLTVMGFGDQYMTTYGGHYDGYWDGTGYPAFFGGTSCACPMSAGVMALIKSYFPEEENQWCWERLEDTADDLHTVGFDTQTGHGRCNALRAVYGSDRYSDLEDAFGFVTMLLPDEQVFDTIHDVPGNPYEDSEDLYRFTTSADGYLIINLDIYTWGEDLDIALYSDQDLTVPVNDSTGPNHHDSSTESIFMDVSPGVEYFLRVYSPQPGSSTTYGLRVHNASNDLWVTGESIVPDFIHQHGEVVPFLKLTFDVGYQGTLDQLIINKSGNLPNPNWAKVQLYQDTEPNGIFDGNDQFVGEEIPSAINRAFVSDLGIFWTYEIPLVLYVCADFSETIEDCTVRLSLESYKDVTTQEGIEAVYRDFPIVSESLQIGTDADPPEWVTTVGIQSADPLYTGAVIGWNEATDALTPPVEYNIYYTDTLPFDIGSATPIENVAYSEGDTTDFKAYVMGLPKDVEQHFVVRAEDQAGNEDDNLEILSCTPSGSGNPANPVILNSLNLAYPNCVALRGGILLASSGWSGVNVYDRSDPINLEYLSSFSSDIVYDMHFDGTYAICAGYNYVEMFDLSNPYTPLLTDFFSYWDGAAVDREADWAYAVSTWYNNLLPLNVANPGDIDDYPTVELYTYGMPRDVEISGDYLYVACASGGIVVLDRSNPGQPSILGTFGPTNVMRMSAPSSILYAVSVGSGLSLYDIGSDPEDPPLLDSSNDGPSSGGEAFVVIGDYVYVSRSVFGIVVYDVSTPTDIDLVGELSLTGIVDMATDGAYIYAVSDDHGLVVII